MLDDLKKALFTEFPGVIILNIENASPAGLIVPSESLLPICTWLHSHPDYYFDHLACLSAVDLGPESAKMEVDYTLYSYPKNQQLSLKVVLDREAPEVESVTAIWRGANWHEREAYDLFGIRFLNHPDLRRILLPADWVGFPMRKDYNEEQQYHGLTIKHPDAVKTDE